MTSEKNRINYSTASPWEPIRGFSRAVCVGDQLFISGTTAISPSGEVVGANDAYLQTRYVISHIRDILSAANFAITDVVRTRMFITSMADWDKYARAHCEAFEHIRPASSIVQVSKLVDPRLMLELEVEAIRGCKLSEIKVVSYQE